MLLVLDIWNAVTSTLTARLSNRPSKVVDIDAVDVTNELAVTEYVKELYRFYKIAENESRIRDYLDFQPDINEKMRAVLIDWLVEAHRMLELSPEALYLIINIIDRYPAVMATSREELQLLGIGAMLVASKYEEEVDDLVFMSLMSTLMLTCWSWKRAFLASCNGV